MRILDWLLFNIITADIFDHHTEKITLILDKYFLILDEIMKVHDSFKDSKNNYR